MTVSAEAVLRDEPRTVGDAGGVLGDAVTGAGGRDESSAATGGVNVEGGLPSRTCGVCSAAAMARDWGASHCCVDVTGWLAGR